MKRLNKIWNVYYDEKEDAISYDRRNRSAERAKDKGCKGVVVNAISVEPQKSDSENYDRWHGPKRI